VHRHELGGGIVVLVPGLIPDRKTLQVHSGVAQGAHAIGEVLAVRFVVAAVIVDFQQAALADADFARANDRVAGKISLPAAAKGKILLKIRSRGRDRKPSKNPA